MNWDNPFVFIAAFVVGIIAFFVGIGYLMWHFPNTDADYYRDGKTVCVTKKGWNTFYDTITCTDIKLNQ